MTVHLAHSLVMAPHWIHFFVSKFDHHVLTIVDSNNTKRSASVAV